MKAPSPPLPALQRIAELRAEGKSQRAMAEILQAEGVPLPPGRAKRWNQPGVQACLQQLEEWEAEQAPEQAPPPPPASGPAKMDVHIHGPWIKQDGVLWEFLLHRVWDDLDKERSHTLPLEDALLGLQPPAGPRDRAALCAALDRLARSCVVIVGAGGARRVNLTSALIAAATSENIVNYQFPDPLLRLVKIPQQYVQLQELLAAKS